MKNIVVKFLLFIIVLSFSLLSFAQQKAIEIKNEKPANFSEFLSLAKVKPSITDDEYRRALVSQLWTFEKNYLLLEVKFHRNGHFNVDIFQKYPQRKLGYAKGTWRINKATLCIRYYEQSNPDFHVVDGVEHCKKIK